MGGVRLEDALARAEADAESVLKAAAAVTAMAKRLRAAAHTGNLRDLRPTMGAVDQAIAVLHQEFAKTGEHWEAWEGDEEAYFARGAFTRELLETAARLNVRLYEQDDRLYSYPSLIRVLPAERAVLIDKTRERRLRPTVLVTHLRDLQRKPPRFRPEVFLEALYAAYDALVAGRGKDGKELLGRHGGGREGPVVRLLDVYGLLTLLPGQSREYSRQEFARDIYLLDQSGVTTTRRGHHVRFPASTGTRAAGSTVRVVTQGGREKVYYGISFAPAG